MPSIQKTALVPYSAEDMYALVNGVEQYPDFLPWCAAAEVLEATDSQMIATLTISKGFFREKFTTRNTLKSNCHIHLSLVDGPFSLLEGDWHFTPQGSGHSRVDLDLRFEFGTTLTGQLISPIFDAIAHRLVEAFCARAEQIYRDESTPRCQP